MTSATPAGLVGITEAARHLGLHKSTVSRFVKANPELDHGGANPAVSVEEIRALRNDVNNPARGQEHTGTLFGEENSPSPGSSPAVGEPAKGARLRREAAMATEAEMDLAERLGETVPRDEVDAAIRNASALLHDALVRAAEQAATRISPDDDERKRQTIIRAANRAALDGWTRDCSRLASNGSDENGDDKKAA